MRKHIVVIARSRGGEPGHHLGCAGAGAQHPDRRREETGMDAALQRQGLHRLAAVNSTTMPANWVIEDQAMKVFTGEGKKPGQGSGGDILYGVKKFANFELHRLEDREGRQLRHLLQRARSAGKAIYYAAPEVQVLDNIDATDNKIASHLAGSLYDMLAADPKTVKPVGEWNTIVIRVKDGKVTTRRTA